MRIEKNAIKNFIYRVKKEIHELKLASQNDLAAAMHEQNMKLSPQGSFSEAWITCKRILGSGTVTEIPMRNGDSALTISSASIFTESGWHDVNVSGLYQRINCWSVVFDTSNITDLEIGKSYLIKLSGNIS